MAAVGILETGVFMLSVNKVVGVGVLVVSFSVVGGFLIDCFNFHAEPKSLLAANQAVVSDRWISCPWSLKEGPKISGEVNVNLIPNVAILVS